MAISQTSERASAHELAPALPADSALDERGRLLVGGCDTLELARHYGTPAYVIAENDLLARARAFLRAGAQTGHEDFHVAFAAKAFPCTALLRLFASEGLWCDVASGGELHLALGAGFAPERILLHGNAKTELELQTALELRIGLIVIDNFDEIDRLARLLDGDRGDRDLQDVLIRVTPDVRGDTHDHISTGQADSKFGFGTGEAHEAIARIALIPRLRLLGLHAHIGSQLLDLEPFRREVSQLARLGDHSTWDLGGGLGVRYNAHQPQPPSIDAYVRALISAATEHGMGPRSGRRLLIEPGRSLCANAGVTLYTVQSVRRNISHWVAVDGGMSDNLRPMLYGARYEAHVADRLGGRGSYVLAGMHCESGDVIVRDALLDDPRPGDLIVVPATGAYGYAMASNYNGTLRPPVIFCRDSRARLVVRRETFADLTARDVL